MTVGNRQPGRFGQKGGVGTIGDLRAPWKMAGLIVTVREQIEAVLPCGLAIDADAVPFLAPFAGERAAGAVIHRRQAVAQGQSKSEGRRGRFAMRDRIPPPHENRLCRIGSGRSGALRSPLGVGGNRRASERTRQNHALGEERGRKTPEPASEGRGETNSHKITSLTPLKCRRCRYALSPQATHFITDGRQLFRRQWVTTPPGMRKHKSENSTSRSGPL